MKTTDFPNRANLDKHFAPTEAVRKEPKDFHSITVCDHGPAEVYAFWRDLRNAKQFMRGILDVTELSSLKSEWTAKSSTGVTFTWQAEVYEDIPGKSFSWRSIDDSQINTSGSVWFTPYREGTVVNLKMEMDIPGGRFAELLAFLKGEHPHQWEKETLYRLRALVETGEIPTTEGQPSGRESEPSSNTLH